MTKSINKIARAMLIDDEAVDLMIYKRVLGKSGLVDEVVTFSYAEDALTYLCDPDSPKVDLIFLDINMPRMNGFEFLEAYEQGGTDRASAPVMIMLTTSLADSDRERAEASRLVRGFFNKPLTESQVAEASSLLGAA